MTQSIDQIIGGRLRSRRGAKNLRLYEVAAAVGKHESILARYEGGTVPMSVTVFVRVCGVLGVTPATMLAGLSGERVARLKRPKAA